jgi:hypothetical protein
MKQETNQEQEVTFGHPLEVNDNGKLVYKYAQMPITSVTVNFLVQMIEPVLCVPKIVTLFDALIGVDSLEDKLSRELAKEWEDNFIGVDIMHLPNNFLDREVELVECNLLVPKKVD